METNVCTPSAHAQLAAADLGKGSAQSDASGRQWKSLDAGAAERWPVVCPICGGSAARIALRLPAQWLSRLVSVRRYRCDSQRCGWHGNLFG